MKEFAHLFYWYDKTLIKIIRFSVVVLLFLFSVFLFLSNTYPNFPLFVLFIYLMLETFFIYKVCRLLPQNTVISETKDSDDVITIEALAILNSKQTTKDLITALIRLPQVKFIVAKADANEKDIKISEINKQSMTDKALELTKKIGGKYITTMDLFIAYLMLTEEVTKFLFDKKLKDQDVLNILFWARSIYSKEESDKGPKLHLVGEGFAESLVYGWTIETGKYMLDLSKQFLGENELKPTGRKQEFMQIIESLSKGSSALLVGDAGSGKESAVRELAIESFSGRLSGNLFHQRIYQLMVDALMAGASNQGELEQRLNAVIAEVAHSGNVIIYIPEFQNILGSSTFNLDISGALIPYLKKGAIRIIAAVTPGAYKRFVEPLHSLLDSFAVINFDEPKMQEVLEMLFRKAYEIEAKNKVLLTYKAITAACEYAGRYVKEKALPGSAVTLLDDSANSVRLSGKKLVEEQDILDQVQKKIKVSVGEPKVEEKELLLNLETQLHRRIIGQAEAVSAIAEAIRRLRSGIVETKKPISFLFLGPTGVGKTETAKALADVYYGNSEKMIRLDMSEFSGDDGMKRLLGSVPGQGDEKGQLTEPVYDSPYSLVLLDEFEKADQKILDLFLQVLDDGRLTDNKGKTVSFVNTIIIATSNAASEYIREEVGKGATVDKKFRQSLLAFLQTKGIFKPELLNRFDDVIIFKPLSKEEIVQIVGLMLKDVEKRLSDKDITVEFSKDVLSKIADEGFDKDFGARPLRRFIQDKIEDIIAQEMLKDELKRGDSLKIALDPSGNILINK